jgi:hypothetical protein
MTLRIHLLFPAQAELRPLPVVAQGHYARSLKLLVEKEVIGKSLQTRPSPAAGVEMKPLRMFIDQATRFLELLPEVVTQGTVDGIVVAYGTHYVPPNLGMKRGH